MQSVDEDWNPENLVVQGELLEIEVKRLISSYDTGQNLVVQKQFAELYLNIDGFVPDVTYAIDLSKTKIPIAGVSKS
jgi:hypothetical protein